MWEECSTIALNPSLLMLSVFLPHPHFFFFFMVHGSSVLPWIWKRRERDMRVLKKRERESQHGAFYKILKRFWARLKIMCE